MDRAEESSPTQGADEATSSIADDYMWGWELKSEDDRRDLGLAVAKGWGPNEDIRHFTTHSLLRGVEEWDQMISCAAAMKEKATSDDPLAGQDLLTFLSRLVLPHTVAQWATDNEAMLGHRERSARPPPPQKNKKGIKRKRKGPGVKDSPYFATTGPQTQPQTQAGSQPQPLPGSEQIQQTGVGDKKSLTKGQKKRLRKQLKKQLDLQDTRSGTLVLQEASVWYRNDDNVAGPNQAQEHQPMVDDVAASPDGGVSLKESHS